MAQFVIGSDLVIDDSVRKEKERKEQENQEKARRHYKKDSRYLEDLYTLTYQEDSLDRDEDDDPEIPAWGASRAPLRSPQPLASLQVSLEWSPLIGWSSGFKDGGGRGKAEFHQLNLGHKLAQDLGPENGRRAGRVAPFLQVTH